MNTENRYDKTYKCGKKFFKLKDFYPTTDQCHFLMIKVIEQAVRDYSLLKNYATPREQFLWETARNFLFEDGYRFFWGKFEITTEEFLDILDLDIHWIRDKIKSKFKTREQWLKRHRT